MNITVNIKGLDDAVNKLLDFADGDKLESALFAAGEVVRSAAQTACPVDTGRLHDSIQTTVSGNSALIGTNVEYGIYVEFGTGSKGSPSVAHTSKKTWTYYKGGRFYTTSGQAPQPFMVPALENNVQAVINAFKSKYGA